MKQIRYRTYITSDLKAMQELKSRVRILLYILHKTYSGEMNDVPQPNIAHQKSKWKNQDQELSAPK